MNGQPGEYAGYLAPPPVGEGETLLHDEPGRCRGIDSHAYHFRVVRAPMCRAFLLVRHGGGDERIRLSNEVSVLATLDDLDSEARYWLLCTIYHAQAEARRQAQEREAASWRQAAAERRIKVRKVRGQNKVRVTVAPARSGGGEHAFSE